MSTLEQKYSFERAVTSIVSSKNTESTPNTNLSMGIEGLM